MATKLFKVKLFKVVKNSQVRYVARKIAGDNVVELNENTVTGRLLAHLNENQIQPPIIHYEPEQILNSLKHNGSACLSSFYGNDLSHVIHLLSSYEHVENDKDFFKLMKLVDVACCHRLVELSFEDTFLILSAYVHVVPNRITDYPFYKYSIKKLYNNLRILKKKELLKLFFYIGLEKKSEHARNMLKVCLKCFSKEMVDVLTVEEVCVIANSTFKTSTKINNIKILDKIRTTVNENITVLDDPALFVTLIKTLRHNRYQDDNLLNTISYAIFFNKSFDYYTFPTYCHILALYSDYLFYDERLLLFSTKKCIEYLRDTNLTVELNVIRGKDIKRFLWALSNLNCKFLSESDIKQVIIPKIIENIENKEFDKDPYSLIDICLYLWMLRYKPYELIPHTFIEKNINAIRVQTKSNSQLRLNQLLTCIYYEDRKLFKEMNIRPNGSPNFVLKQHLKDRPVLSRIHESLKNLSPKLKINKFEVCYQVPYINILGITGYTKNIYKTVYIEVLDHFTSLKNQNNLPTGLMQMKLRILDGFEEGVLLVRQEDINTFTESELQEYLFEEINLVC